MGRAGAGCTHGTHEECVQSLDGESEGKRLTGRPGVRQEYITMDLKKNKSRVVWIGFICSGERREVGSCDHRHKYLGFIKFRKFL
jgi:beta-xylosidase